MGDIDWIVLSLGIAFGNDLIMWIMAIILVVAIINVILGVFYDNNK